MSASAAASLALWEAFGVELEYMIVDARSLDVRPIADSVLRDADGEVTSDVERGDIDWSNELTRHVIELKTAQPAASLTRLEQRFQPEVAEINRRLAPLGARLMPTAMHPWMQPDREMELWPHDCHAVYESFNQIFDCRGHGWANLQSVHLNLPFANAPEFGALHAAIRLVLPLLPALAASSPLVEKKFTGVADNRMEVYRHNARRVPLVSGAVVPEPCFTPDDYHREILRPLYAAIAPYDPLGVLQFEWLNARGAIARFDRSAIEIRVLDVQECPAADLAICRTCVRVLQALVAERWSSHAQQQAQATDDLAQTLYAVIRDADRAIIADPGLLGCLGVAAPRISAGELWQRLAAEVGADADAEPALQTILNEGPLSRRIERAIGDQAQKVTDVYRQLCDCLAEGRQFHP